MIGRRRSARRHPRPSALKPTNGRIGVKYATIDDVARRAGVSVATVSRALRGLPNVAERTRARVLEAASSLDYAVHPNASRLASRRTHTIGVIAPRFGTWYVNRVVAGAESILADADYDLLIAGVNEPGHFDPFLARARSFGRRIDGALLVDVFLSPDVVPRLDELHSPAVSVGERLGSFGSLTIDNVDAADRATQHLIDLGHTRVGAIGAIERATEQALTSPVAQMRLDGFTGALRRNGLEPQDDLIVQAEWTVAGGAVAMGQLLDSAAPPSAVFCMSDEMAIGARLRANDLGLRIPEQLSLMGFDDHDMADAFGISTMRQDADTQGRRAAGLLLEAIDGRCSSVHEVVDVELVVRNSTGPLQGG